MDVVRRTACLAMFAICVVATSLCQAETLRILNWEAFLSDATIAEWEARTGARISQTYFDNDEARNSLLTSYDQDMIDLVVIDQVTAPVFGRRGLLLPVSGFVDTPNLRHIAPEWSAQCGEYSIPYLWGTMGLVYRKDKLPTAPTSWQALLTPAPELVGHIGILEDYIDMLAPSLLVRGQSVNTADEIVLAEVFNEMRSLLPAILTIDYSLTYVGQNPDSDVLHLALSYGGDQHELNALTGRNVWEYVIPEEGTVLWVDCLAVSASSSKQALAFDFINFINQPDVAAANSEALFVATPNASALPLQSEEFRNNPLIYPDANTLANSQHYDNALSSDNVRLRNRITSSLVNIHESQ